MKMIFFFKKVSSRCETTSTTKETRSHNKIKIITFITYKFTTMLFRTTTYLRKGGFDIASELGGSQ